MPSYNQGEYIEQSILSVLDQDYPNLEFIIMDGGSSDCTVSILEKYQQRISFWVSQPDGGQSAAINSGFKRSTGDILCWLNSDDYYLPGTLMDVNQKLDVNKPQLLFGNARHQNDADGTLHNSYFDPFKNWDIQEGDYIVQPSSFWTRKAFETTGELRENLNFGFDWEWYARATAAGVEFIPSAGYYSVYRIHAGQKSNDDNPERFKELTAIARELKPDKFEWTDQYILSHLSSLKTIYRLTESPLLQRFEYRLLKLLHPDLMKKMDRITLKKYISLYFSGGNNT